MPLQYNNIAKILFHVLTAQSFSFSCN